MDLKGFFNGLGYDISEKQNWDQYLNIWESWYQGKVKKFHNYYIYNGNTKIKMQKKSLQMAKKLSEDWADLLFNEKVNITVNSKESQEKLNKIFDENNHIVLLNQGIEKAFAHGTGAFVGSIQDLKYNEETKIVDTIDGKIKIEYVEAKKIYPLSWEGQKITECAFVTEKYIKGTKYIYISMHLLNVLDNYVIQNYLFEVQGKSLLTINEDVERGFLNEFDTKSNVPWFTIIRPNIVNNIEENPFGISVYANSIDVLKCLDNNYDALDNEVVLSRKRIFVAEDMMTYDNGTEQLTFDPADVSIYRMPKGFNNQSMIHQSDMNPRIEQYIGGVEFQLKKKKKKSGFGENRYRFDGNNVQTATAVISENSDMYRTIKKHELPLETNIKDIVHFIAYASSTFKNENIDDKTITVEFDDSIIEDKNTEKMNYRSEVTMGLRSKKSYMTVARNLNEEEIQEEFEQMRIEAQNQMIEDEETNITD